MPNEGSTVVGSIVGRLRLDRDQWIVDREKTKEDARELGALRPTIKVDVNAAEAVAKLEAVRMASERLALATDRTKLAYLRLDEIQNKGGASQARLLAAHMAAARAEGAEEVATKRLAAAKLGLASANDLSTASTIRANEANKTSVSRLGLIGTAIGVLIPLLAPLMGYSVGVAGALTGMGAAGVLSVLGIRNAMASGTAEGNKYSAGLQVLLGDLRQLEGTAATAMLGSFNAAISTINSNLPSLNSQISVFSTMLGNTGNLVLQGAIRAFQVLNPLFVQAGVYVEQLAAGFLSWSADGGAQKFGDYAMRVFPQVADTLGALAKGLLDLLDALAPLGQMTLGILQGFGGLLSLLSGLGSVLPIVVAGASAAFLAFKAWGLLAPILSNLTLHAAAAATSMRLLGAAEMIATGPIGWVIAGVSALAAVLAVASIAHQDAKVSVDSFSAALQADSGAIGENVRAQAAKNLQDAGALAAADKLGISTKLLMAATLGEAGARKELARQLVLSGDKVGFATANQLDLTKAQQAYADNMSTVTGAVSDNNGALKGQIAAYNAIQTALGGTTISTKAQLDAQIALANQYGLSVPDYLSSVAAQQQTASQLALTTAKMQLQNDAAGLLRQSWDLLNGKTLTAADAQNSFDSSLVNMGTHVTATGKQITFTTANIHDMSSASVALRGQLNGQVRNLEGVIEANGGVSKTTQTMQDDYVKLRQQIIDNAVAHGVDRDAVTAYIDEIFKIPKTVPPTQLQIDASKAEATMAAFFARWNGATVNLTATTSGKLGSGILGPASSLPSPQTHAAGGTVYGPGTATSDSVLMRASAGEEVIRQSRASAFRPMLKAINNGSPAQIAAQAANLAGPQIQAAPSGPMQIRGTLDLGNGLTGFVNGVLTSAINSAVPALAGSKL